MRIAIAVAHGGRERAIPGVQNGNYITKIIIHILFHNFRENLDGMVE
jgi:hypothetical protein